MDYSQEWGVREEELAGRLLFDNQEGRGRIGRGAPQQDAYLLGYLATAAEQHRRDGLGRIGLPEPAPIYGDAASLGVPRSRPGPGGVGPGAGAMAPPGTYFGPPDSLPPHGPPHGPPPSLGPRGLPPDGSAAPGAAPFLGNVGYERPADRRQRSPHGGLNDARIERDRD